MSAEQIARICIAKEFSTVPAGRFPDDGPANGERFRNEYLIPALTNNDKVVVFIDGTEGYGSSFLDEAFAGLITHGHFNYEELKRKLVIESDDPNFSGFVADIKEYLDDVRGR